MKTATVWVMGAMLAGCGGLTTAPSHESLLSGPGTEYAAPRFNYLVYSGDVTGDGNVDLFVTGTVVQPTLVVGVLAGDGAGHFGAPVCFDETAPQEMASGDFDGDGNPDVVGINNDGMGDLPMFFLRGDGHGGFTSSDLNPAMHYWSGSIGAADFTGDGLVDVVAPYQNDDPAVPGGVVIRAAPDFTEVANVTDDAFEFKTYLAVGDFDNDGHPDVVVTTSPSPLSTRRGQIGLLRGDGAGHLSAPTFFPAVLTGTRPVVADFNGDGALDVALADRTDFQTTEQIAILLGDGHGGLGAPRSFSTDLSNPAGAAALAAGDFDGDGLLDLVVGAGAPHMTVLHGDGHGNFRRCDHIAVPNAALSLTAADFDGNGGTDVAAATGSTTVAVFLNE